VEVSDEGAVGTLSMPDDDASISSSDVFEALDADEVGTSEQSPIVVVVAKVASDAQDVEARFADGSTDSMTPVDGWVVLVDAPGAAYDAGQVLGVQLTASGAAGTLGQVSLSSDTAEALPTDCVVAPITSVPVVAIPATTVPATAPPSTPAIGAAPATAGTPTTTTALPTPSP
jgi:hypothetical protein